MQNRRAFWAAGRSAAAAPGPSQLGHIRVVAGAPQYPVRGAFNLAEVREGRPRTLVFMDVEGAEDALLPDGAQHHLRAAHLVIETHPAVTPGVIDRLARRFAPTHLAQLVVEAPKAAPPEAFGGRLSAVDAFIATWEWRRVPTPWLVMVPRDIERAA